MALSKRMRKIEDAKFKKFKKRLILIKKDKVPKFGETEKQFKKRKKLARILRKQKKKGKRKTKRRKK